MAETKTRYVFITGGVVSSLGKGITAASLGRILKNRGMRVAVIKLDPYINVDPGTMSPFQHGEVFVTDDGAETDLDLGHYERFTGRPASRSDNITTGRIYQEILEEANAIRADLIVMSSHRPQRHAVRTYFLGSNAGHVVRYAKCSVLVVRN